MAEYPNSVYAPRYKANRAGVVYDSAKATVGYVEDVTKLDAEVVAVETELGANPKGTSASVLEKIKGLRSLSDATADTIVVKGGNVGIGTASPLATLQVGNGSISGLTNGIFPGIAIGMDVSGISSTDGGMLGLVNTGTQAIDRGGSFIFAGTYTNGNSAVASWARLTGGKENATSGDYSGYFSFSTRHTGSTMSERMRIDSNGNVGIGTTGPGYGLDVEKAIATGGGTGNLAVFDTTSQAAGQGGAILFGGAYTGTTLTTGAVIRAEKTNSVAGDFGFGLGFYTRANGSAPAENMVINSSGNVGIGITSPTAKLHLVAGTATAATAPLKFTAGVVNTTKELGAVEFVDDGTDGHLYITLNVGGVLTRKEIAFVA